MSLSQYIRDNTNDGTDIAGVLIDVMNGRIHGASVSHRLTAAKLLTIYGYGDVDDFTDANTPEVSDRKWAKRVRVSIGSELTALIKANTDDGQAVVMFLIDIMEGRAEGANVEHRISAAKELLNRAFGKSRSRNLPKPPGSKTPRRSIASKLRGHAMPPEVADFEAMLAERVAAIKSAPCSDTEDTQSEPAHQPVTPASVRPEPVEGRTDPPTQTAVQSEPTHQPVAPEPVRPELVEGPGPVEKRTDPPTSFRPELVEGQSAPPIETATLAEPEPQPDHLISGGQPKEFDFDPNDYHY